MEGIPQMSIVGSTHALLLGSKINTYATKYKQHSEEAKKVKAQRSRKPEENLKKKKKELSRKSVEQFEKQEVEIFIAETEQNNILKGSGN